jgi:putative restriction endonuclease
LIASEPLVGPDLLRVSGETQVRALTDPIAPDNVWLREEAAERQIPLIYFLGVSPGRYQVIIPTFIVDWDARRLAVRIAFGELAGATAMAPVPDAVERRYALRLVKQRLHQAAFRDLVLAAYDHRCAISNLPDDYLLDAAHIIADAHELLGEPVVANGIALSKIHHAAFDNHLIGREWDSDPRGATPETLSRRAP